MNPITGLIASQAIQAVTRAAESLTDSKDTDKEQDGDGFESVLRSMLQPDQANMVNEEELFAAVVRQRIQALKGEEGVAKFDEALAAQKASHTDGGYVWLEDAVGGAIKDLEGAEVLSADEAKRIYSESFAAAQLDDNKEALFDSRGGGSDPTRAVNDMEAALMSAKLMIEQIESGDVEVDLVDVGSKSNSGAARATGSLVSSNIGSGNVAPEGEAVDGAEGFLFKPESDHGGSLVVLLPHALKNQVESLILKDAEGNTVEDGRDTGYGNGDRQHFRFSRPGSSYPANIVVEAKMTNGSVKTWEIPNPALRYD